MKKNILFLLLIFCVVLSSCISNKDLVYFQNKETSRDTLINNLSEIQKPYRVQVNDILNIRVKALDQESVSIYNPVGDQVLDTQGEERAYLDGFTVDIHGNIRIPVLGEINVLGYTTEEIRKLLEQKLLKDQFKETANIFVTVKLAGLRYVTNGEIGSPGVNVIFKDRVNIFEAIANAGDITITGDRKDVLIIRQYPQGQQIHSVDLTDINVMKSPYYFIQNNDMIYIKPLRQKSWGTGVTGADTFRTLLSIATLLTTTILLINR